MTSPAGHSILRSRRWMLLICGLLLAVFVVLSFNAADGKSPTFDEPYHAMSAWRALWRSDLRFDTPDPPLWKYWAAWPNGPQALSSRFFEMDWPLLPMHILNEYQASVATIYRTKGVDVDGFFFRSRMMMLAVGAVLGLLIPFWTWRLQSSAMDNRLNRAPAAAFAALVATAFFSLDPTFLGHAPLIKNDVASALCFFALMMGIWSAGHRLTFLRSVLLGLLCGMALTVKFSGVLAVALLAVCLLIRALLPYPWLAFRQQRITRWARLLAAAGAFSLGCLIAWACIWAVYQFRFAPSSNPDWRLDMDNLSQSAVAIRVAAEHAVNHSAAVPTQGQIDAAPRGVIVSAVMFANRHHLLPQAWLSGFLYTYASALIRPSFLLGHHGDTGWWWYFPFAMAVKTPVATLVAIFMSLIWTARLLARRRPLAFDGTWVFICVGVMPLIYLAVAMRSNLNLGLRHMLPVYPFLFVLIGLASASLWQRWPRIASAALFTLFIALAVETGLAYPDYIAFFNKPAGGSRGGLRLLSDSNLDWGQDLPLLAAWQQAHPDRKLYLCYFGVADPAHYGIVYTNLPGGYMMGPPTERPKEPGVIAISATYLMAGNAGADQPFDKLYRDLRSRQPIAVLGGSIYLYDFVPKKPATTRAGNTK